MTVPATPSGWTYSGDPASSERDEVRFLVQDTDVTFPILMDAELDYLLGVWMPRVDSTIYVAAVAAEVISRKFAGVVNVSADGVSVNTADLSERYHVIASRLRDEYKAAGADAALLDLDNLLMGYLPDASIAPLTFWRGMHDNPEAGEQDYGGTINPWNEAERIAQGRW